MPRIRTPVSLPSIAAILCLALTAAAQDAGRPLPFSDDQLPPPPLPQPLDRHFKGELVDFDGERVKLRWDWSDAAHLEDFDAFVPVRKGLQGGFSLGETELFGQGLHGQGTGGLRLRMGMLDDLAVRTEAKLLDPHDLGIVLVKPDSSDESIVCLVQDRLFTDFDAAAGNTNMINKIGGIPATAPGVTEFRYVARSKPPALARGERVGLTVLRKGPGTTFTIAPDGRDAVVLKGDDTDTPMTRFTPGLYVSGGAAEFGALEIDGAIDVEWCADHDVLPHIASNLLHPGNRFKGKVKGAATKVQDYLAQGPETPEKKLVSDVQVAALVGQEDLPLVIRIRAAEAMMEKGIAAGTVVDRIVDLLDAGDRPARLLSWQVLRPQLPWHFRYDPDGPAADRREAALLIGHYFRERDDALAMGKVFVEGYWMTPSRADAVRAEWDQAWDLRSSRVRLRTNLTQEWAVWYLAALDAAYAELVRVVGREPDPAQLPLSVLVFRTKDDFAAFCNANGYEAKAAWGRFVDLEKGCAFITFDKRSAPFWSIGQMSKLFLRRATDRYWPSWFEEGRSSWFGNPSYGTASWDGRELVVGKQAEGHEAQILRAAAQAGDLDDVTTFMGRDPRTLAVGDRRRWYAHAWALHHWFMSEAPDDICTRFARWQQAIESRELSPRDVDAEGRTLFLRIFAGRVEAVDSGFLEWVKQL